MAPVVDSGDRKDRLKKKGKSKHTDNVLARVKGEQKSVSSDGDIENKQWFEDRNPGDGSPMNSFPAVTRKALASDSDSSANKSWYEIVEEDENADKIQLEGNVNGGETILAGVKIKQEKIDELDCVNEKEAKLLTSTPLLANIKIEKDSKVDVKKELIDRKIPKAEIDVSQLIKKEEKPDSVALKREREVKSSLSSESDSDIKEKRVKHQKQERRSQRTPTKKPKETESSPSNIPPLMREPAPVKEITPRKGQNSRKESSEGSVGLTAEDLKLARLTSLRKRNRDESKDATRKKRERNNSTSTDNSSGSQKYKVETDPATLARRQKQIDFGKNTVGYDRYLAQIPKEKRTNRHPRTPPKHQQYSRRAWDGMVKIWRQELHIWDPPGADGEIDTMSEFSTTNSSSHFSDDYTSTADSYDDGPEDCLDLGHQ